MEEVLRWDWVKAAHFYAARGITEERFRRGVPRLEDFSEVDLLRDLAEAPIDARTEERGRQEATLPG
ncbi:MAG TPA: hypothetical protein VGG32_02480 [Thermoplasmata archaeon]